MSKRTPHPAEKAKVKTQKAKTTAFVRLLPFIFCLFTCTKVLLFDIEHLLAAQRFHKCAGLGVVVLRIFRLDDQEKLFACRQRETRNVKDRVIWTGQPV